MTDDSNSAIERKLTELARDHAAAARVVDEYARRRFLTPGEELELHALKRLKLVKKDAMAALERQLTT